MLDENREYLYITRIENKELFDVYMIACCLSDVPCACAHMFARACARVRVREPLYDAVVSPGPRSVTGH